MEIVALVLIALNGIVLVGGVIFAIKYWFIAAKTMFTITSHYKKEHVPWGWRTMFNPFNGLILVNHLTKEGKEIATVFWKAIGMFILSILIPFALAYLTETITGVEIIQHETRIKSSH